MSWGSTHADEAVLAAEQVTLGYDSAAPPAVVRASIKVGAGESVGIVGESGSGKTTLARGLVGGLMPRAGSILVNGRSWSEVGRRDPERRQVQMVFQDPYSALNPTLSPLAAVAEVRRVLAKATRSEARLQAAALLERVGLHGDTVERRVSRLSGGQRQRVGIARALACEPRVLIADEPTSSLDVSVQAQILNLFLELREERGVALVLVTHDLAVLKHVTDYALVMYRGRVCESGPTSVLLDSPAHPYTAQLVGATQSPATERATAGATGRLHSSGCVFAHRCTRATDLCDTDEPASTSSQIHSWACYHPIHGPDDRRARAIGPVEEKNPQPPAGAEW
jgi:peptide/nickel transport system ATP-binding protein